MSTRSSRCFCVGLISPDVRGREIPRIVSLISRVMGCARALAVRAGQRFRGVDGEGSREAETPGEERPPSRGNSSRRERSRGRTKASRWVKPAERTERRPEDPERPGEGVFGHPKRELIVDRGVRQLRESAGVDETVGDKIVGSAFQHTGG